MGYQPWYRSQTYPSWTIPLYVEGSPDNIAGLGPASLGMIFRTSGGSDTNGTGVFNIITSSPAIVTYTPSTGDVASVFTGEIVVTATFPSGGIAVYDPIPFTVTAI